MAGSFMTSPINVKYLKHGLPTFILLKNIISDGISHLVIIIKTVWN